MLLLLLSCLASKVTKLENDVVLLQQQNAALEQKVLQLEHQHNQLQSALNAEREEKSKDQRIDEYILEAIKQADREEIVVSKQRLIDEGAQSIMTARLVPHRHSQGFSDGFRVFSVKKTSFLRELGLRNRDIIIAINGQASINMLSNLKGLDYSAMASELLSLLNPDNPDAIELTLLLERRNRYRLLVLMFE